MENLDGKTDEEPLLDWGDIRRDIAESRPKEDDFRDCFEDGEIYADKKKVEKYKKEKEIEAELGVSDSQILEYTTIKEIEEMDWFGELEREDELFEDKKSQETVINPTSEFDDYMNHIDAICVIKNADSRNIATPFALDMTYNTDSDGLEKKMLHKHPNKKVNMPGLATAKYFEDTFSYGKPIIKKGRVKIMPRFIIGYSPELATKIAELRMSQDSWSSLQREELSAKAKWCTLKELKAQSERMLEQLKDHSDDHETLFGKAYSEVRALDKYFEGAINAAKEKDKNHPDWEAYADNDEVVAAILSRL